MKNWFIERLGEKSTYVGLSLVLGACGVAVDPLHVEAIAATTIGVVGAIEAASTEG